MGNVWSRGVWAVLAIGCATPEKSDTASYTDHGFEVIRRCSNLSELKLHTPMRHWDQSLTDIIGALPLHLEGELTDADGNTGTMQLAVEWTPGPTDFYTGSEYSDAPGDCTAAYFSDLSIESIDIAGAEVDADRGGELYVTSEGGARVGLRVTAAPSASSVVASPSGREDVVLQMELMLDATGASPHWNARVQINERTTWASEQEWWTVAEGDLYPTSAR